MVAAIAVSLLAWQQAEQSEGARERERIAALTGTLVEARARLEQARSEGADNESAWAAAAVAAEQARELVGTYGGETDLARSIESLCSTVEAEGKRARLARSVLRQLDRSAPHWERDATRKRDTYLGKIFALLGVDPARDSARVMSDRVLASGISDRMIHALDEWAQVRFLLGGADPPEWRKLTAAAMALDPAPRRTETRKAFLGGDVERLRSMAGDLGSCSAHGLVLLARALQALGKRDAARLVYEEAHRRYPADHDINHDLGTLLAPPQGEAGEWAPVVNHYKLALAARPDSPHALADLGYALYMRGDLQAAKPILERALQHRPDWGPVLVYLGATEVRLRDFAPAIRRLTRATGLMPASVEAWTMLGAAWFSSGKPSRALEAFKRATAIDPEHFQALAPLSHILVEFGHVGAAIDAAERMAALRPGDSDANYNLGTYLLIVQEWSRAVDALRIAVDASPDSAEVRCNLGLALMYSGDPQGALLHLRKGHELGTKSEDWSHPSAEWLSLADSVATLADGFDRRHREQDWPDDPRDLARLGWVAAVADRPGIASDLLERALNDDPRLARSRFPDYLVVAIVAALKSGTADPGSAAQLELAHGLLGDATLMWSERAGTDHSASRCKYVIRRIASLREGRVIRGFLAKGPGAWKWNGMTWSEFSAAVRRLDSLLDQFRRQLASLEGR